ncbi:hypothetical protein PENCOP_c007G03632 [Penicillium coprophilum]|uniref:Sulfatase N-terminal domain-containing protein n=1 Tax=Penicillium coprophilum TaxID=36646 RepID=A0A1V6ULC8_9EURO|nr:hypothetical protein PENCOP_c007G03632 [Penicillium coprophilum]
MIPRQSFTRPFVLSLLIVSVTSSKLLHLLQHASSLPGIQFALYFPTFFIIETLLCITAWGLLFKTTGVTAHLGTAVTVAITSLSFILASSQICFYFVTGSEIPWDGVTTVGSEPEGRKLMLSGLTSFLGAAGALLVISWLLKYWMCILIDNWMSALLGAHTGKEGDIITGPQRKPMATRFTQISTLCIAIVIGILRLTRPQVPYNHMSETIPFSFFQALGSRPAEFHQTGDQSFPLAGLTDESYWESPHDHFKGWAPGKAGPNATDNRPAWASGNLPPGFERWSERKSDSDQGGVGTVDGNGTQKHSYSPVNDPLRITNLDREMLEPVAQALKDHKVPITHVVVVLMESARKDIFPFKAGSHLHEQILSTYDTQDPEVLREINAKLSHLSPNAEKLTGVTSGLSTTDNNSSPSNDGWKSLTEPGMGGINFNGIITGSSVSLKSEIMNYCGAGPLPVNSMDEVKSQNYQPCIMQVFELFNQLKENSTQDTVSHEPGNGFEHIHDRNWSSVFLQSITGQFDEQYKLNKKMGFHESIYREDISKHSAKYYHKNMKEINYFGQVYRYPEYEIYPYLRDVVNNTIEKNERLFLSHLTSTTHHPWGMPTTYQQEEYFAGDDIMATHRDMNKYLNTVRFVDGWLGDIMKVFDEAGIANETLVVFVGDHGQAFAEDAPASGTYENGHISNFRIPLVFRHPLLPALQITANATSMSVVPTILDLLVNSGSLNEMDSDVALDLMNEYQGQSLVRPYQATHNGRQAWNFGIINPGGTMLSIGSAAVPYRLILPLTEDFEYTFSNLDTDPDESSPLRGWSLEGLISRVQSKHGDKAGKWLADAEKVGKWWIEEQKILWNYQ